jgi:hypothetical protein
MTLYEAARRWIADSGLPHAQRLDRHQVWSIVDQTYPGGWTAFRAHHNRSAA